MQRHHLSILAALPVALLFACAAGAQTTPAQPPQPMPPPPPPTAPPQSQNGMPPSQGQAQGMQQGSSRSSGAQEFTELAGRKGYVTRSEAASDPWLAQHFAQCDRNHNGKVTRSEFRHCHRQS